jgi:hypothetical protein
VDELMPQTVQQEEEGKSPHRIVLDEAKERHKRGMLWEGPWRLLSVEDTKFANADSDNGWQWPDNVKNDRDTNNRPCLTINKTKTIVLQLANEAKQNPPEPRVKPVGGKVSFKAAEIWEGLIRHIKYVSDSGAIQGKAKEDQLEGGIGYWRITHDFIDDSSFDQDIFIKPLEPLNVLVDCDIKTPSGADAMWGFIFEEFDRREFERKFPQVKLPPMRSSAISNDNITDDWIRSDGVRVAEYYRIKLTPDELLYIEDANGDSWTGLRSELPPGSIWTRTLKEYEEGKRPGDFRKRDVQKRQLEWYKIAGDEIIEERLDLKGKYIPIVREVGRERKIQGQLYRAGIVRALKDAQRSYNYNSSGECEVVALQTKSPWVIAAEAIEGNETAWAESNTKNAAYLTWRHRDEQGDEIPPPERKDPPTPSQGFLEGLRIAAAEMEMASGLKQTQQQNPALERTPVAIDDRIRSGEAINYDFTDHEMQAIRHTAVIIIDLAPHIYDTKRVVKIRAEDGTVSEIMIDPDAEQAYHSEPPSGEEKSVKVLFNPTMGKYAVEADVGPSYQTQRQETWHAFVEITTRSPELMNMIGDLGFLAADFPMAQQIADRIRRNIEQTMPWLLQDGQVGPVIQKMSKELQDAQNQIGELMEKLTEQRQRSRGKDELRDIEAMRAEVDKGYLLIDYMTKVLLSPQQKAEMEHELTKMAHEHVYSSIAADNVATLSNKSGASQEE